MQAQLILPQTLVISLLVTQLIRASLLFQLTLTPRFLPLPIAPAAVVLRRALLLVNLLLALELFLLLPLVETILQLTLPLLNFLPAPLLL